MASTQPSWGCSPELPLPTLRQNFEDTPHVFVARLVSLTRSPLPGDPTMTHAAIEDATFDVLLTLKGPVPSDGQVKTHTEYMGGNCTLSIIHPIEVLDKHGEEVENPYSDIWILFLAGEEPYRLSALVDSLPMNLFNPSDLRFLLSGGPNDAGPNNILERARED